MSILTSLIGGFVVTALVVRGAIGFINDFKSKTTSKEKQ